MVNRRALLTVGVVLPLFAMPAPVAAQATSVSPSLARLIEKAGETLAAFEHYRSTTYDAAEEREVLAKLAGDERNPVPDEVERRNIDLLNANTYAEWSVAGFPARTAVDFYAKIMFMIERQMFDGLDHSDMLRADAARLAGVEVAE